MNNKNKGKYVLIGISVLFIVLMLILPMITVIFYAFSAGIKKYKDAVLDTYAIKALELTLIATVSAVIINTIFGLFASWLISKLQYHLLLQDLCLF